MSFTDREKTKPLRQAMRIPFFSEVGNYINYILLGMKVHPQTAKSVCILALIYIE